MSEAPQIRYLTGNGQDSDDNRAGTVGFIFNRFDTAAIQDLIPGSNWFAAGDVTAGPTEVQQGDVFLVKDAPAERVAQVLGIPRWAGAGMVVAAILAAAYLVWRVAFKSYPGA